MTFSFSSKFQDLIFFDSGSGKDRLVLLGKSKCCAPVLIEWFGSLWMQTKVVMATVKRAWNSDLNLAHYSCPILHQVCKLNRCL